jgi:hypothetical protein
MSFRAIIEKNTMYLYYIELNKSNVWPSVCGLSMICNKYSNGNNILYVCDIIQRGDCIDDE